MKMKHLTLGIDSDNELVADLYDERNEAVKRLLKEVISIAKRRGKKIGICGDAPSTYPEIAEFLVESGIDSMSITPDAVLKVRMNVAKYEESQLSFSSR